MRVYQAPISAGSSITCTPAPEPATSEVCSNRPARSGIVERTRSSCAAVRSVSARSATRGSTAVYSPSLPLVRLISPAVRSRASIPAKSVPSSGTPCATSSTRTVPWASTYR